jgi:hypothetical protein
LVEPKTAAIRDCVALFGAAADATSPADSTWHSDHHHPIRPTEAAAL